VRTCALAVLAACSFRPTPAATTGDDGPGDAIAITSDAAPWWNDAWFERIPITIENAGSAALGSGLQVAVMLDLSGGACVSPGAHDDVRIVYGATELPRVIDSIPTTNATWFGLVAVLDVGATSRGEYWLYCRNGSAAAVGDLGSAVFEFYDPFDALDGGRWQIVNGATTNGGMLVLDNTNDTGVVTQVAVNDVDYAVDFAAVLQSGTADWWGGFQSGTADVRPWSLWYQHDAGNVSPSYIDGDPIALIDFGTDKPQDTALHIYSVEDYASAAIWRFDDVLYQVQAYSPLGTPPATFDLRLWNNSTGSNQGISFDWVRLRRAASPTPIVGLGSAEMR
jgi:hypothetical protein